MSKKENLKPNKVPATIFIGLGGIGSDIIKRVGDRCLTEETENVRFVSMDTNVNDLKSVKESKHPMVAIQTSSTKTVLDYLDQDEEARREWFPNNTTLYGKNVSEGAGQVRAISRLALNATIKTGEIQKLYKAIDSLFMKDGKELKQTLRVVIVASAVGGTGSGIAMTLGMLVRNYLHKHYRGKSACIRGLLIMPGVVETVIDTEKEKESLRRNGYATIKEISAFMMKGSGFCGVNNEFKRYDSLHVQVPNTAGGTEKLEGLPFDFCFLLERINQEEEGMESIEQYKEFAAQSLYEQNIGPMQEKAFGMEDNVQKEFGEKDSKGRDNNGRNRFGGIGASVLRYPYDDVVDYVAYSRAMQIIGDGKQAGQWLKYDKKFEEVLNDYKKNRTSADTNKPELRDVYISQLNTDPSFFGIDVKKDLCEDLGQIDGETAEAIENYAQQIATHIKDVVGKSSEISGPLGQATKLNKEIDYSKILNAPVGFLGETHLKQLRNFEYVVDKYVAGKADSYVKGVLCDSKSIRGDVKLYDLESLLKTVEGAIHPNAMRYMLYKAEKAFLEYYEKAMADAKSNKDSLKKYGKNVTNKDFDVRGWFSKGEESSIDAVVALEKENPTILEKIGGYDSLWTAYNKHFKVYADHVIKYYEAVIEEKVYEQVYKHLQRLNAEFEKFYSSFKEKVVALTRRKEDIIDKLKFENGDSVVYVCSKKVHLDRIVKMCGSDLRLSDALNAEIYDAVKYNAEVRRQKEIDEYAEAAKVNIFDGTMMGYIRNTVEAECAEIIDVNIIDAIENEVLFENNQEEEVLDISKSEEEKAKEAAELKKHYLKEKVLFGKRLAAPGVGSSEFNEPRNVCVCAFSNSLLEMRDLDVKQAIESFGPSPAPADSVSKYDLRFFNAYYDITPEKLSRFKSPEQCEEDGLNTDDAGLYYNAYQKYMRRIGPDSTKSATISVHIDKRWDSIIELPEMSMFTHKKEMVRIHSALIYGVVYRMIRKHLASTYDPDKLIYKLEDEEGDLIPFTVSNKTECDEFYEVLDALYRDRAAVEKIHEMVDARSKHDEDSNHRYEETSFATEVASFKIGGGHPKPTSLFEIPLSYYNSLPRSKMDENEVAVMIDSVIAVLEKEVRRFEQVVDQDPFLAKVIEEQFKLLIDNFTNDKYNKKDVMRKNTDVHNNPVINMTLRKVTNKLKKLNRTDYATKIKELRDLVED